MKKNGKTLSVIMPSFNEGAHIRKNVVETWETLEKAWGGPFEIIVVDDGSSDNTHAEALAASRTHPHIKVVHYKVNRGKGGALKEGFMSAEGDYVAFLDADLDLHPSQIPALFKVMEEKGAQIVIGSKHHPSSALKYPAHRRLISRVYAIALKLLFKLPVRDTQTGLKIFKAEVLKRIFPKVVCARYAYDLEILANAHRLGYTIAEAPIVLNFQRVAKWGRIRTKDLYRAGMDTLAIFYRMYFTGHYKGI
ncbi:MAG: glycosyltransferase [Deltaproteobacteria bacterium]|nr:glycosyltransferase [Deltaproteobacteria bacterium]